MTECIFLDECPAFTDYPNKANPILNPDFHKYCMNSNNEKGYCPLYDNHIYVLKALTEQVRNISQSVRGITAGINVLEEKLKTE